MTFLSYDHRQPPCRRRFLGIATGFAAAALLAGCGGSSDDDSVTLTQPGADASSAPPPPDQGPLAGAAVPLNLALNLEYVAAHFYAYAGTGAGLPATSIAGVGRQGAVSGGRRIAFSDTGLAGAVAELAADKRAHVDALRGLLGATGAAQPAIDLSAGGSSAFARAMQASGVVGQGASFDPFADDREFLLAAFLIEHVAAAGYRTMMAAMPDGSTTDLLQANLAGATYHGALIRTLLSGAAAGDPSLSTATLGITRYVARLDGSDGGDQALAEATGESANLADGDGSPIPFRRGPGQVLKFLYLSPSGTPGGFLPQGANGIA